MKLVEQKLAGLYLIALEPHQDERGFFARSWCQREFLSRGLDPAIVQCNISFNKIKGTLRGMHFQKAPHEETKVVRCTRGQIFDVVVDIRPDSKTFGQWLGFELSEENHQALYIPKGFAHGFQTLCDHCEVHYQMGAFYEPALQGGLLWNDPRIAIRWPLARPLISPRDQAHLTFEQFILA